jgi:hypothetical protein
MNSTSLPEANRCLNPCWKPHFTLAQHI